MDPSLRLMARRKILSGPNPLEPRRLPSVTNPSSAEVTKMVSPHTIGVAALQLGIFARQTTFCVWVQFTGRSCAVEVLPFDLGPRHCGQFASSDPARKRPAEIRTPTQQALFRRSLISPRYIGGAGLSEVTGDWGAPVHHAG